MGREELEEGETEVKCRQRGHHRSGAFWESGGQTERLSLESLRADVT